MKKLITLILLLSFTIKAQDVTIGTQTWTTKNLDVSKFRNGEAIPFAKTDAEWKSAGENKQPAWCYLENKTANGTKYGKLYNWYAVNDPRGLAPKGYHIPEVFEWTILTDYLGGELVAGKKMKSTTGWRKVCVKSFNTNSSGFAGLPGGRSGGMAGWDLGNIGYWWSSSIYVGAVAWSRQQLQCNDAVYSTADGFEEGLSVRCLRDIALQDVTIGTQTWTTKNLDVSTYRNGDTIPEVQDAKAWANLTTGAWCYYENKTANGTKYGKLYNWYAVNDARGLAPKGYRIPTDDEWTKLKDYLGDSGGEKIKSSCCWDRGNATTNTTRFSGLPGGCRNHDGSVEAAKEPFNSIGVDGFWWSSSEVNYKAYYSFLESSSYSLNIHHYYKGNGFSVRCIKD